MYRKIEGTAVDLDKSDLRGFKKNLPKMEFKRVCLD
jgi:hypothetical protein